MLSLALAVAPVATVSLFAAAVPVGWTVLARREARDRAQKAAGAADTTEAEPAAV